MVYDSGLKQDTCSSEKERTHVAVDFDSELKQATESTGNVYTFDAADVM
mgnify:CR=1 FL=1